MIIFEIMAAMQLILAHIHKGELAQQEKRLKIEYQLVQLREKLNHSKT